MITPSKTHLILDSYPHIQGFRADTPGAIRAMRWVLDSPWYCPPRHGDRPVDDTRFFCVALSRSHKAAEVVWGGFDGYDVKLLRDWVQGCVDSFERCNGGRGDQKRTLASTLILMGDLYDYHIDCDGLGDSDPYADFARAFFHRCLDHAEACYEEGLQ